MLGKFDFNVSVGPLFGHTKEICYFLESWPNAWACVRKTKQIKSLRMANVLIYKNYYWHCVKISNRKTTIQIRAMLISTIDFWHFNACTFQSWLMRVCSGCFPIFVFTFFFAILRHGLCRSIYWCCLFLGNCDLVNWQKLGKILQYTSVRVRKKKDLFAINCDVGIFHGFYEV